MAAHTTGADVVPAELTAAHASMLRVPAAPILQRALVPGADEIAAAVRRLNP
jgi:hypothetical protein